MDKSFERQPDTGLFVPRELAQTREVWLPDEMKLLKRVSKLVESKDMAIAFWCKLCKKPVSFEAGPGGLVMECGCKRREVLL